MRRCVGDGPTSLSGPLTSTLVGATLGAESRDEVLRMFCVLKRSSCRSTAGSPTDSGHPFADLLHLPLFPPWHRDQEVVRIADLRGGGVTLLINAASNRQGEPWSAGPEAAGVWHRSELVLPLT